jgi:3-hydroxybutyryl-CoA dehydratase
MSRQTVSSTPAIGWSAPFEGLAVGQRFSGSERVVGEADVIAFCALTGDWHPQHCDPAWAASSAFGERIAHGMLVLSFAIGLLPLDPQRVLALRGISDVVFKRPVRLGESISAAGELTACRAIDERAGLVELGLSVRNQADALVCRGKMQVLWRRDGVPSEPRADGRFWHEAVADQQAPGDYMPVPL